MIQGSSRETFSYNCDTQRKAIQNHSVYHIPEKRWWPPDDDFDEIEPPGPVNGFPAFSQKTQYFTSGYDEMYSTLAH